MVKQHICNRNLMKCKNKRSCFSSEQNKKSSFPYGTLNTTVIVDECSFREIKVKSRDLSQSIFPDSKNLCYAHDGVCVMNESTIIWDKNNVRNCKYEKLVKLKQIYQRTESRENPYMKNGERNGDGMIFTTQEYNEESNSTNKYIFVLNSVKKNECGLELFETTEGTYMVFSSNKRTETEMLDSLDKSKLTLNSFHEKSTHRHNNSLSVLSHVSFQQSLRNIVCSLMINSIRLILTNSNNNKYVFVNFMGNNIYIYLIQKFKLLL